MLEEGCIEVVVSRGKSVSVSIVRVLCMVLTVCFFFLATMVAGSGASFGITLVFVALIFVMAFLAWFLGRYTYVDYEYALVDRELRVAKILNKENRKHMGTYDLNKMEILARSTNKDALHDFSHRQVQTLDYSNHHKDDPNLFELYLPDTRILLTLDPENPEVEKLVRSVRTFAPRKVAMD